MFNSETILLGMALAIDSAVVSFALGLLDPDFPVRPKILRGLGCSLLFGLFQFSMLWLGSYGGYLVSFSNFGHLYPFIVAAIFIIISAKFFYESFEDDPRELKWGLLPLLILGVATSIDALASGVSLGVLPNAHLVAMDIGLITFFLCGIFFSLSQFFKSLPERWPLRLAGIIFLFLGGNIILVHVFKGAL